MNDVHIRTENQTGGITAQNVNYGGPGSGSQTRKPASSAKKLAWWVFGLAGVIGAIAGVAQLFN